MKAISPERDYSGGHIISGPIAIRMTARPGLWQSPAFSEDPLEDQDPCNHQEQEPRVDSGISETEILNLRFRCLATTFCDPSNHFIGLLWEDHLSPRRCVQFGELADQLPIRKGLHVFDRLIHNDEWQTGFDGLTF